MDPIADITVLHGEMTSIRFHHHASEAGSTCYCYVTILGVETRTRHTETILSIDKVRLDNIVCPTRTIEVKSRNCRASPSMLSNLPPLN
jgi:hypothetical protein